MKPPMNTVSAVDGPVQSRLLRLLRDTGALSRAELAGHGDLGADLARWRALGKVSMRVARTLLGAGPLTVPRPRGSWQKAQSRKYRARPSGAGASSATAVADR